MAIPDAIRGMTYSRLLGTPRERCPSCGRKTAFWGFEYRERQTVLGYRCRKCGAEWESTVEGWIFYREGP